MRTRVDWLKLSLLKVSPLQDIAFYKYNIVLIFWQKDLSRRSQNTSLEHEFQSNCALFLCNKWDLVRKNKKANPDKVKEDVIKKLKNCWPGLVTEDQVFFMSVEEAKLAEEYGRVSADFENFVNSIGSMILNSCKTRLEIHWR